MNRFVLGFLVGALAMHWYVVYGGTAVLDVVDWFQGTAGGYGASPSGTGWAEIKS